jgi:hypothetical protein
VVSVAVLFLSVGPPLTPRAPLEYVLELWVDLLREIIGDDAAIATTIVLLSTPSVLTGAFTYAWLRRRPAYTDGFLHCLKCGYILKGLSEPRCPECGERI